MLLEWISIAKNLLGAPLTLTSATTHLEPFKNNDITVPALTIHQTLTADVPPTVVAVETSPPPASPATPGPPERGSYNITNATDAVCLLARMGLQLNISFISSSHGKVRAHATFTFIGQV